MSGERESRRPEDAERIYQIINGILSLIQRWGLPNVLAVFVMALIWFFPSNEQKEELIDKWLLFKGWGSWPDSSALIYIIFILVLTNIGTFIAFRYVIRNMREENNRLGKEKSALQKHALGIDLASSEKEKK